MGSVIPGNEAPSRGRKQSAGVPVIWRNYSDEASMGRDPYGIRSGKRESGGSHTVDASA